MFGRKNARIAELENENDELTARLSKERQDGREKGRLSSELLAERDAARIERDTAQRERDEYRIDALKHRSSRAHLKQFQPKANGAAVQGAVS